MQRLTLGIVPCSNLMPSMMVATLGIALPEIRQTFSLSTIAAGSLFSTMMIIAALTSFIAGRLADRIGRKAVLISGLSFLALGFGAAGITGDRLLFSCFSRSRGWATVLHRRRFTRLCPICCRTVAGSVPASCQFRTASVAPSAPYWRVESSPPSAGARPS